MESIGLTTENISYFTNLIMEFIPKLATAIVLLLVGLWVIKMITKGLKKVFKKKDYDETLEKFLVDLVNWGLKIILFVLIITQLGVKSTSLVAIVGAAGLAVGLALQGSLANFAGGVLILVFRPFRVGDYISAQDAEGTVKEISIFTTTLLTLGNEQVIIPNGNLSNDKILNLTAEGKRKDTLAIGISYDSDIKLARKVLIDLMNSHPNVIKDSGFAPDVVVTELADSAVNLAVRYWVKNEHYWGNRFELLEDAKTSLEGAGISIPFPQQDVHMHTVS